nr:type II toxin-antitoxin system antitoxin SocA domain-containing protein [Leuconostoc citreum]
MFCLTNNVIIDIDIREVDIRNEAITYSANKETVADWFIQQSHQTDITITPKKLQKLLYYAYAWGLVFLNETSDDLRNKLFDGHFEAWVHGPVDAAVYQEYKKYGYQPITEPIVNTINIDDKNVEDVLSQVWSVYSRFEADELEALTHHEDPWIKARQGLDPLTSTNVRLNDEIIFNFYGSKLNQNG